MLYLGYASTIVPEELRSECLSKA